MSQATAELEARLELLEYAFFGSDEDAEDDGDCYCDLCQEDAFVTPGLDGTVSPAFTDVVLDGAEQAIARLTDVAENGDDAEALEASRLLLHYGLALVDRGRA